MITKINIKNFKSIRNADIDLQNLNLLMGLNSSGKSTTIQALLLLRQSFENLFLKKELNIAGELANLGDFSDIYPQNADPIGALNLALDFKSGDSISFVSNPYLAQSINSKIAGTASGEWEKMKSIAPLFSTDKFQYIAADRIAPQNSYPQFSKSGERFLGIRGEYTAHYLYLYGNENIALQSLRHEKSRSNSDTTLNSQVNLWASEISPNLRIKSHENDNKGVDLRYSYFDKASVETAERKPINLGFGITPILPILVALLSAKAGDLIIIENPEIHLHPKGQSRIGMLMAYAAQAGVQIIVETHSDHVLNGIRVAAFERKIEAEKIQISFFSRSIDDEETQIHKIQVTQNGRLGDYPEGLLDEWDNMLDRLLY